MASVLIFTALANSTRRCVITPLRMHSLSVAEIQRKFNAATDIMGVRQPPLSRSAISQALKVLLEAKMVKRVPRGNRYVYQLDDTGFAELRLYLEGLQDLPGFSR